MSKGGKFFGICLGIALFAAMGALLAYSDSGITTVQKGGCLAGAAIFLIFTIGLIFFMPASWFVAGEQYVNAHGVSYCYYYGLSAPDLVWSASIEMHVPLGFSFESRQSPYYLTAERTCPGMMTGDEDFDRFVYANSDDPELGTKLRACSELRLAILRMLKNHVSIIECATRKLTATVYRYGEQDATSRLPERKALDVLADDLAIIKRLLPSYDFKDMPVRDRQFMYFAIAMRGVGLLAVISFWVAATIPYHFAQIPCYSYFATAGGCVIVLILAALWTIRKLFSQSPRGHDVIRLLKSFGLVGICFSVFFGAYCIDILGDHSSAQPSEWIVGKTYSPDMAINQRRVYFIQAAGAKGMRTMEVDRPTYMQVSMNSVIRIMTHPGLLGYEWIEKYEVILP